MKKGFVVKMDDVSYRDISFVARKDLNLCLISVNCLLSFPVREKSQHDYVTPGHESRSVSLINIMEVQNKPKCANC
jgi:hypothetical protein